MLKNDSRPFFSTVMLGLLGGAIALGRVDSVKNVGPQNRPTNTYETTGCAANALFVVCQLEGFHDDYKDCLTLLPRKEEGNSVLEVKRALEKLTFKVGIFRMTPAELASLRMPAIVLTGAVKSKDKPRGIGHYYVVRPIDKSYVQVLDCPGYAPKILSRAQYAVIMRQVIGKKSIACFYTRGNAPQISDVITRSAKPLRGVHGSTITINKGDMSNLVGMWKFGTRGAGEKINHVFHIRNELSRTIHIVKVLETCGCTSAESDKKILKPDESAKITATVDLSGKKGPVLEMILVKFSHDDNLAPIRFYLNGKVNPHEMVVTKISGGGTAINVSNNE